ncbi:MAG: hypothetical protein VYB38_17460 [Bacteroidota bacterium]|mgnify:CR=1 FL=1|nr:hypothetical protein [Bacteroidota bacterium]MEE3148688.1 hypothetical protein [Bacteroidota bacterium]MEE3243714.1 hypothetical protein [Bacteroidota bacterium]
MNYKIFLVLTGLLSMILTSEKSEFMKDCTCKKIDLTKGLVLKGSGNRYSVTLPNKDWNPVIIENGLNAAVFEKEALKFFGIVEMKNSQPNQTLDEQQQDIEHNFDVIESGTTMMFNKKSIWNLVKEKVDTISLKVLYVTVENPKNELIYTLSLGVSSNRYGKKELCELETIIKSFKLN